MTGTPKTHLTSEQRLAIQNGLNRGMYGTDIAAMVGKALSTVTREIERNKTVSHRVAPGRRFNDCINRKDCPVSGACSMNTTCRHTKSCVNCPTICGPGCRKYVQEKCIRLNRFPFVCNACEEFRICTLEKCFYDAEEAQKQYKEVLSSSRAFLHSNEEELEMIGETLKAGFDNGQSISHICSYAGAELGVSQSTLYNYINEGVVPGVCRLDMPKAVRFHIPKPKKGHNAEEDKTYLIGRRYADYLVMLESNAGHPLSIVEMDCVEGRRKGNGRVLMTLLFQNCNLQLAYVLERKTEENVIAVHAALREQLGIELYMRLFQVIVTDRGSEFKRPDDIEFGMDGTVYTSIYYCDSMQSQQKPRCERNHSEIRRVIPKGTDITCSQEKINVMMDNINSNTRALYQGRSAYEMFVFIYGQEAADKLGLRYVKPTDVTLTPALLD